MTSGSVAASAPPRVLERLRQAPDGPRAVLHRGRHAVYLDLDGWCLGVVGSAATQVPCALRLGTEDLAALEGSSAHVEGGVLHLDATPVTVGRVVGTQVPRFEPADVQRRSAGNGEATSTTAPAAPPAAVLEFVESVGLVRSPARALDPADVARLVGRGDGLTPLGDDVLCGWLALHRAAGRATLVVDAAVRSLLPRTTLLSATLLDCALHGEVLPEFAAYVAALGTPDVAHRAAALAAVGHTSGAGLLYGALLALAELHHTNGVAA
ncbi:oxamate carbamoyltransferase subunit AllH family protein [Nocardioides sp. MAHUQ-72]|uniref:oxamate carbamoyltransferase subunit AllH family protein n=1 Tax=unclassified Nocardioides TaxID=2615069 RepID=UPI00360BF0CD